MVDSFVLVELNGQKLWLPPDTLRTMTHCTSEKDGCLSVNVERAHFEWMRARLEPGMHFIDVGSSTGAICLPFAKEFGSSISITAFEPARRARALLVATAARNGLAVKVLSMACSDHAGRARFFEWPDDEVQPWCPEGSTLADTGWPGTQETTVDLTTLDVQFPSVIRAVVKIDVEGHEATVLAGATEFLARVRPPLSIDIHLVDFRDPERGTTENTVREALTPLGYKFEKLAHVLVCEADGR